MAVFFSLLTLRVRRSLWRRKLARVSPFVRGQLLAEARRLNRAGYTVAAVVTARVAIERILREMALAHPEWNPGRAGISDYSQFLWRVSAVSRDTVNRISGFTKKANSVTHGGPIGRTRAWQIIRRAAAIATVLEGGAAC